MNDRALHRIYKIHTLHYSVLNRPTNNNNNNTVIFRMMIINIKELEYIRKTYKNHQCTLYQIIAGV